MNDKVYTVITGGSKGIGFEFAKQYSTEGKNLVLISRNKTSLIDARDTLLSLNSEIEIIIIDADLTVREDIDKVKNIIKSISIETLINNAGFGIKKLFQETDISESLEMVDLNIKALLEMEYMVIPQMIKRGSGVILNVASIASFMPIYKFNVYSSTKAFVLHHSLALRQELEGTGIRVCALAPGSTISDFWKRAGTPINDSVSMPASRVVSIALKGIRRDQEIIIPGFRNILAYYMLKILGLKLSSILSKFIN